MKQICHILQSCTVNHQIFANSKFGNFKRLTYWCSLILAVSQYNVIKVIFCSHSGYFKGKNMLPKGSIFYPLIVAPFKTWFSPG